MTHMKLTYLEQTEWCYNYHNAETPFLCKVPQYPTPSEQTNFFSSYVSHRPTFPPAFGTLSHRASTTSLQSLSSSLPATPASMHPSAPAVGMISTFMLEARSQPALAGSSTFAGQPGTTNSGSLRNSMTEEDLQSEAKRREIERLRWETRAWRGVNSAQWIMWGIVQAKVPGMPAFKDIASPYLAAKDEKRPEDPKSTPKVTGQEWDGESKNSTADGEEEENEEGFDYLKYAFERARFFWGDILALGIMKEEEIPEDVRALARVLEY
jgi:choline kinase